MTQAQFNQLETLHGLQDWRAILTHADDFSRDNLEDLEDLRQIACRLFTVEENQTEMTELLRRVGNRVRG